MERFYLEEANIKRKNEALEKYKEVYKKKILVKEYNYGNYRSK